MTNEAGWKAACGPEGRSEGATLKKSAEEKRAIAAALPVANALCLLHLEDETDDQASEKAHALRRNKSDYTALPAAVALLRVVALALVDLREKSRLEPDLPAEAASLTTTELRVLRHQSRRPLDTVRAVCLALAALGGHLGRKGGGPPGWQTLWLGRRSLRLLVESVNMAAQLPDE